MVTGKPWRSPNLWSLDVAEKWMCANDEYVGGLTPTRRHQDMLRACNLQTTLVEALRIESDLAFKGSKCTIAQKVESRRRLTMLCRALCVLQKAFVKVREEPTESKEALNAC